MAVPPDDDVGYRRYWGRYNRPYGGCGCLYTLLVLVLLWFLCSLVYAPLAVWETWGLFLHLVS